MIRKKQITMYVSEDVLRFLRGRAKDKQYPYWSPSDYLEAMVMLDQAGGVPHQYLWEIIARPEFARAELLEELRKKIDACKKKNAEEW